MDREDQLTEIFFGTYQIFRETQTRFLKKIRPSCGDYLIVLNDEIWGYSTDKGMHFPQSLSRPSNQQHGSGEAEDTQYFAMQSALIRTVGASMVLEVGHCRPWSANDDFSFCLGDG